MKNPDLGLLFKIRSVGTVGMPGRRSRTAAAGWSHNSARVRAVFESFPGRWFCDECPLSTEYNFLYGNQL